jgi:hypothetical protein
MNAACHAPGCSRFFDTTEEDANAPGTVCPTCWHNGWRPDGVGNVLRQQAVTIDYSKGPHRIRNTSGDEL